MKVLFISSSIESKFNPFLNGFKKLDIVLDVIYYPNYELKLIDRIKFKLLLHSTINQYNNKIINHVKFNKYDLTVVVKGMYLKISTTKLLRNISTKLVYWSNDDISLRHNNSYFLRKSLKFYDVVYTMKILNILNQELMKFNVRNCEYLLQCFSEDLSYKANIERKNFKFDVIFVGTFEYERFETIKYLVENGIKVNVFGNGWDHIKFKNENLFFHEAVTGDNYLNVINSSKISLCFLRKANRDSITVRSVEIPAYSGFLLGEYSVEHQFLFQNKIEAIWCKNNLEFLSYINYYLHNDIEREKIVRNSYERVHKLNCSYESQARYIKESLFVTNRN